VKSRIQRSLLDLENVAGDLLDPLGNRLPVLRLKSNCLENQEVQRALRKLMFPLGFYKTNIHCSQRKKI